MFWINVLNNAENTHNQIIVHAGLSSNIYDTAHDKKVSLTSGSNNNVFGSFKVPANAAASTYDLNVDLYFDIDEDNKITDSDLLLASATFSGAVSVTSSYTPPSVNPVWQNFFSHSDDFISSIEQTQDCGYIVAGNKDPMTAPYALVLKLNSIGALDWSNSYGDPDVSYYGYDIRQTSDGGYILSMNDWVLKLNSVGAIQWMQSVTQAESGEVAARQTSDGGYIVAGNASGGNTDTQIWKLTSAGAFEDGWPKSYHGSYSGPAGGAVPPDGATAIEQTSDGGYVVAGWVDTLTSDNDVRVLKLYANGSIQWDKKYDGIEGIHKEDHPLSIRQTSDGGYIVGGCIDCFGNSDALIIKLNKDGDKIWKQTDSNISEANSVREITDGYIAAGGNGLIKFDNDGNVLWRQTFNANIGSALQTFDGGYVLAGDKWNTVSKKEEAWIFKVGGNSDIPAMATPNGVISSSYPSTLYPILSTDPATAKPLAVGATDDGIMRLQIGFQWFACPVDIYLFIYAPGVSSDYFVIKPDLSLQPLSQGFMPWRKSVTGPIDEGLFGDIPLAALPASTYMFYAIVTPAGTLNSYYLWDTNFIVPPPILAKMYAYITVTPDSYTFGNIESGATSSIQTFTITNSGYSGLSIQALQITGPNSTDFTIQSTDCPGTELALFSSCAAQVRFAPSTSGEKTASLSITFTDTTLPGFDVQLSGTGTSPVPKIAVSPTANDFGSIKVGDASALQTFTVSNSGSLDLVIRTIALTGANPSDFTKGADTCTGHTIVPQGRCTVRVMFSPVLTAGLKSANLAIPSNDPVTPTFNASLSGIGVNPVLTVSKSGLGTGIVTGYPTGINCGTTCAAPYNWGTQVTLTAAPGANSAFTGWSGGGCSGTGSCVITLNADTAVTADFVRTYTLTVSTSRSGIQTHIGAGAVIGTAPSVINCGAVCSETVNDGTVIWLNASRETNSNFTGWTGCPPSQQEPSKCSVTLDSNKTVIAGFAIKTFSITELPGGGGTITPSTISNGAWITSPHTAIVTYESSPTFTITPDPGATFMD
ncbi:MAG: choice-of-anchor D domain-containing protein, partial [Nitrospirae bacterium]|nr:choice-of-anchor D domain-containing protein [Nitrospirota bacterium]